MVASETVVSGGPIPDCSVQIADVVFLMDNSYSVDDHEYAQVSLLVVPFIFPGSSFFSVRIQHLVNNLYN